MNTVEYILNNRPLNLDEKIEIKKLGRATPLLDMSKRIVRKDREFVRLFKKETSYDRFWWMCGCPKRNKVFCFVCLLSDGVHPSAWLEQGVNNINHLCEKAAKHEKSPAHLNHSIDFKLLGNNLPKRLNASNFKSSYAQNEQVYENRHFLRHLITSIKLCEAFDFVNHNDKSIFRGSFDLEAQLSLKALENHPVFKNSLQGIEKEVLDAMFKVCRNEIVQRVAQCDFVGIQVGEVTDGLSQRRLLILRYVFEGQVWEHFWGFIPDEGELVDAVMRELDFINIPPEKLIAQSYDSIASDCIQSEIRKKYPTAYHVNCFNSDSILEKASTNVKFKTFFANLHGFSAFLIGRVPGWTPQTKPVEALRNKPMIHECLEKIVRSETHPRTLTQAYYLMRTLNCTDFNYFLKVISHLTPLLDSFFEKVVSRVVDRVHLQNNLNELEVKIQELQDTHLRSKRKINSSGVDRLAVKEYCDAVVAKIRGTFDFVGHLAAAKLLDSDLYYFYSEKFPCGIFNETVETYGFLDKEILKTELDVVFRRGEMYNYGTLPLLTFLYKNDLKSSFSEVYKLLEVVCTTPMITSEAGRCFSTMSRVCNFVRSVVSQGQDRLDALAMLTIDKQLVQSIADFDNKVIDIFASNKDRQMDFGYK